VIHAAGAWVAEEVELAFGGVAPKAITAPKTEQVLQGKPWDEPLLKAALETLAEDVNITPNAPGVCLFTPSTNGPTISVHQH
jgi:CO/xanthine dehydrogenase FAD-binding subunit